jgi:hypothetical protein
MPASPPSIDWAGLFSLFSVVLILGVGVGLLFWLMRREKKARWPGGKVGKEQFFSFSNVFPVFRPTQAQFDAWREECARLTKENEELKGQVQKLLAERRRE